MLLPIPRHRRATSQSETVNGNMELRLKTGANVSTVTCDSGCTASEGAVEGGRIDLGKLVFKNGGP